MRAVKPGCLGPGAGIAPVIPLVRRRMEQPEIWPMVMNVMGHTDVRTAMRYQHPALDSVREAIDQRNLRHKPRHNELRVQ